MLSTHSIPGTVGFWWTCQLCPSVWSKIYVATHWSIKQQALNKVILILIHPLRPLKWLTKHSIHIISYGIIIVWVKPIFNSITKYVSVLNFAVDDNHRNYKRWDQLYCSLYICLLSQTQLKKVLRLLQEHYHKYLLSNLDLHNKCQQLCVCCQVDQIQNLPEPVITSIN